MNSTIKMTEPKVEERPDQHYAGIRTQVSMDAFPQVIPQLTDETFAWLAAHGIAPAGPPLVRYHAIDMKRELDVDIGVLVAEPFAGNERVQSAVIPAGCYASLVYTGVENGIPSNGALLEWGAKQGLRWDQGDGPTGDTFAGRVEYFLTGPEDDPDPANWDTEVAIRLRD